MKIRSLLFYLIIIITLSGFAGCNIFKGGSKCDCPKFGLQQQMPSEGPIATIAHQNVELF
ncbi:MAG: hypothetical protein ACK4IY_09215 [Chitinophagales bacterium]